MEPFILKIPAGRRGTLPGELYNTLILINEELSRKPGITNEEWQNDFIGLSNWTYPESLPLTIWQNHGIRAKNVSASLKESFKKIMPEIIKKSPKMPSPFMGHLEFHSHGRTLKEVHFFVKP